MHFDKIKAILVTLNVFSVFGNSNKQIKHTMVAGEEYGAFEFSMLFTLDWRFLPEEGSPSFKAMQWLREA